MKPLTTNQAGLELIKLNEGCVLHIYKDKSGYDTIGVGHLLTQDDKQSARYANGITEEQALSLLAEDVKFAEKAVNQLIDTQLNQNQFNAIVDFTFNLGRGALLGSTLRRRINKGDLNVSDEFMKWIYERDPKTKCLVQSPGLLARRQREVAMWSIPCNDTP